MINAEWFSPRETAVIFCKCLDGLTLNVNDLSTCSVGMVTWSSPDGLKTEDIIMEVWVKSPNFFDRARIGRSISLLESEWEWGFDNSGFSPSLLCL